MSRIPLKVVVFNQPTSVPGTPVMMQTVVPMETRLAGGEPYTCPQPYYDTELDRVVIEEREYPMSRVHYYERAKAAKSVKTPLDLDRYTVGPGREPKRVKISVEDRVDLGPVPNRDPKTKS